MIFFKAGTSFNVIQKAWIFGFSSSSCKNAHDKHGYWFKTSRQQAAGLKCHLSLRSTSHPVVEHSVTYFNNKAARFSAILPCAFFCFKGPILFMFFFGDCPPLSISGSGWPPPPPPLIWRSGSAGGLHRERYVLLARLFWLLYLTLSNKLEWKNIPRSGLISSSSIHSLISLTWSRLISGYGKHNIS